MPEKSSTFDTQHSVGALAAGLRGSSIQDFLYRTFSENILFCSPAILSKAIRGLADVQKIVKMPKPGSCREQPAPALSNPQREYIIRYPRLQRGNCFADFMRNKRV